MIETNPNQKTIRIEKEQCDKNNLYALYNLNALQSAMLDLKGETFKLWCYLNKNQNGYTLALSKVDALRWGIGSKSSYDRAIAELIQKGYLVKTQGNCYNFYELPKGQELIITVNKECGFTF